MSDKKQRIEGLLSRRSTQVPPESNAAKQQILTAVNPLIQTPLNTGTQNTANEILHNTANPETQVPVNTGIETEAEKRNDTIQQDAEKADKKKATFDMDPTLHTKLKVFAAHQGKPMVEVVEQALREYLERNE